MSGQSSNSLLSETMASQINVNDLYQALCSYGIVLIQAECKMNLEVAQRMTRDYDNIVKSIYITSDQVAIVCFSTEDTLLQQTVRERYRVGLVTTLFDPVNPTINFDVGYNSAKSQVQDEVLHDMAHATVFQTSPQNLIHLGYLHINPNWTSGVRTRLAELPSTDELDELSKLL